MGRNINPKEYLKSTKDMRILKAKNYELDTEPDFKWSFQELKERCSMPEVLTMIRREQDNNRYRIYIYLHYNM